MRHFSADGGGTARGGSPQSVLAHLATVANDAGNDTFDTYGMGEAIQALEGDIATLLGKERAIFSLSGKAAQLSMLRAHADRRGSRVVAAHPRSHICEDEDDAIGALYGLAVARTGSLVRVYSAGDLASVREPLAAIVVELPLRRVAYAAPSWDELVAITAQARAMGAAVHLDGARLWEVQPFYKRSHAEIAALFDTVYVSLYKGLGAPAGAALAGSAEDIAAARTWIVRAGAIVYRMFPMVLAARDGFRTALPHMQAFHDRACALATAFTAIDGVDVAPAQPTCNAFVVHLRGTIEALNAAAQAIAEEYDLRLLNRVHPTANPAVQMAEITVGANTLAIDVREAATLLAAIVRRANA